MPANVIAGALDSVLARGGISRAVSLIERANLTGRSLRRLMRETFIDLLPGEVGSLIRTAENALLAGEKLTVLRSRYRARSVGPPTLGVQGIGSQAGVKGRVTIIVENPLGGDDIWIMRNLAGSETRKQLAQEALREASKIVAGSPGRFTPSRERALTELGALRLLNRDAEVRFREFYMYE